MYNLPPQRIINNENCFLFLYSGLFAIPKVNQKVIKSGGGVKMVKRKKKSVFLRLGRCSYCTVRFGRMGRANSPAADQSAGRVSRLLISANVSEAAVKRGGSNNPRTGQVQLTLRTDTLTHPC